MKQKTAFELQYFFTPMKPILVLTLFQCIVGDFFTRANKNFDNGTNHFLVKTPFTGVIQILLIENSVSEAKNWN